MEQNTSWDLQATTQLILDLYHKKQWQLARKSLQSTVERLHFARFHFHEASRRWEEHLAELSERHPIEVALGSGDDLLDDKTQQRVLELGAHVQACVQSLHTIPDILAHGLYFGLELNRRFPLDERKINASRVAKMLDEDASLQRLHELFVAIFSSDTFQYLDALNNHGKHRSVVSTIIWSDLTGKAEIPTRLEFSEFQYDGTTHRGRDIRAVLTAEFDRISRGIVNCGATLQCVLAERKVAKKTL